MYLTYENDDIVSGKFVFRIAYAKRDNKYEIFALYDEATESLKFDAYGDDANFIDGKIVETIRAKGRL